MPRHFVRPLRTGLVILAIAMAVAGCGRRGGLEPPPGGRAIPGEDNAQPEDLQGAQNAPAIGNPIGQPTRRPPPIRPPDSPFVLDFLL